jgi:hypothetical protein
VQLLHGRYRTLNRQQTSKDTTQFFTDAMGGGGSLQRFQKAEPRRFEERQPFADPSEQDK